MGSGRYKPITDVVGLAWLVRYIGGESFYKIGKSVGKHETTVRKYIGQAADLMVEQAQQRIMAEVFPLALDVLKAELQGQLKSAEQGKPVDPGLAERVMNGMFITNRPAKMNEPRLELPSGDDEVTTLAGLMIKKVERGSREPKQLEGETTEGEIIGHEN